MFEFHLENKHTQNIRALKYAFAYGQCGARAAAKGSRVETQGQRKKLQSEGGGRCELGFAMTI